MLNWLKSLLGLGKAAVVLAGEAVDTAVPVAVGSRTQSAVIICAALPYVRAFVPVEYQPILDLVGPMVCGVTPVLALAHVARKLDA